MKEHVFYKTVPSALAKGMLTLNDKEMTFPLPGPSRGMHKHTHTHTQVAKWSYQ